jgi:hypothetical protein
MSNFAQTLGGSLTDAAALMFAAAAAGARTASAARDGGNDR